MEGKEPVLEYSKEKDFDEIEESPFEAKDNDNKLLDDIMIEPFVQKWLGSDEANIKVLMNNSTYIESGDWEGLLNESKRLKASENFEGEEDHEGFLKYFHSGIALFRLKKFEDALRCFTEANKRLSYYQLHYNMALCNIKLGNLDTAIFYLESTISGNPDFFFAYYNLIKIYLLKNNANDAYLHYRNYTEHLKSSQNIRSQFSKADVPMTERMTVASLSSLKLFYKIGAECCFAKSLFQECVHTLMEALKFNPLDPELWCLYAKVFIMKKNFECAKSLLQRALQIYPKYKEAKELLDILLKADD